MKKTSILRRATSILPRLLLGLAAIWSVGATFARPKCEPAGLCWKPFLACGGYPVAIWQHTPPTPAQRACLQTYLDCASGCPNEYIPGIGLAFSSAGAAIAVDAQPVGQATYNAYLGFYQGTNFSTNIVSPAAVTNVSIYQAAYAELLTQTNVEQASWTMMGHATLDASGLWLLPVSVASQTNPVVLRADYSTSAETITYAAFLLLGRTNAPASVPCGPLSIQRASGNVVVGWSGPCQLQSSASLDEPVAWTPLPGVTSPATLPISAAKQFFRTIASDGSCSPNTVGYVKHNLADGQRYLLANPLNGANNNLNTILPLPVAAEGTTLIRWDSLTQTYRDPISYIAGDGWDNNVSLSPGEGFFFDVVSPGGLSVTFIGEVPQGNLINPLPTGLSLKSSIAPVQGQLGGTLGFPAQDGEVVSVWNPTTQTFKEPFTYIDGFGWESSNADDPGPAGPVIPVGTGFFVQRIGPGGWVRTFSVNQCSPPQIPPSITSQPQSLTVLAGQPATFTVTATGTGPLNYHWIFCPQPNWNFPPNLPPATGPSLTINNAQSTNVGDYLVVVVGSTGSVTSQVASLTVARAPFVDYAFPASGSSVPADVLLSYRWRDPHDVMNTNSIVLRLDGQIVGPLAVSAAGASTYAISYSPTNLLTEGLHTYSLSSLTVAGAVAYSGQFTAIPCVQFLTCPDAIVTAPLLQDCQMRIPELKPKACFMGSSWRVIQSPAANTLFNGANATVQMSVVDTANNNQVLLSCVVNVQGIDQTAPTVTGPPSVPITLTGCLLPSLRGLFTATDNCTPSGSLGFTQTPNPGLFGVSLPAGPIDVTVKFTDAAGNATTRTIRVIVPASCSPNPNPCPSPARIGLSSGFVFARPNQTVSLGAVVSGSPTPTFQWYYNGSQINDNAIYSGTATSILTIRNGTTPSYGAYCLRASNCKTDERCMFVGPPIFGIAPLAPPPVTWDFSDEGNPLGDGLDRTLMLSGSGSNLVTFGTTEDFGLPSPDGFLTHVMHVPALPADTLIQLPFRASPGASNLNSYTLIMDVFSPSNSSGQSRPLFANAPGTGGGFVWSIDAQDRLHTRFMPTNGQEIIDADIAVPSGQWNRLALVVANANGRPRLQMFVNGQSAGETNASLAGDPIPGIDVALDQIVYPSFASAPGGTSTSLFIAGVQFRAEALPAYVIAGYGSPENGRIPVGDTAIHEQPAITTAVTGGVLKLSWPGGQYLLQETDALGSGQWSNAELPFTVTGDNQSFTNTACVVPSPEQPNKFYRLRFLP